MAGGHPSIIYGTAWKEEATAGLVRQALGAGFCAIDTANQKRHYREDYVGEALAAAGLPREQLFLQSKYTYADSQDHRMPYDPRAALAVQVRSSFDGSLKNLRTGYLDFFPLHGPRSSQGLTDGDWEVWSAMEELQREGKARGIGVRNVGPRHLEQLCRGARVRPAVVQNRRDAARGWDRAVAERCLADGIAARGSPS